jgi:hypothetical protein
MDIVNLQGNAEDMASEDNMPLPGTIQYNGKYYCFDEATNKVNLFRMETIELSECPEPVLKTIVKKLAGSIVNLDKENDGRHTEQ